MSRQYNFSDEIQPRFAAWLWSIGGNSDPKFKNWAPKDWGYRYMMWIQACKVEACQLEMGVIEDKALDGYYSSKSYLVIDHDEFTEACWQIADGQRKSMT